MSNVAGRQTSFSIGSSVGIKEYNPITITAIKVKRGDLFFTIEL
ncbi:hypothetical protein ATK78_3585 [Pedobacter metabolipauper]|uniref:Uncharacterized protein n=1 Tax=Pedobacter metabolipauper TaxID=425513 RepID=A0A4V6PVZ7_9SPHI|nr:hypothetical protein ATK78_3585 [Pedobacter metabolipauper]